MVRPDYYVSRVTHMVTSGLLIGVAAAPYMFKDAALLAPKIMPIIAVVSLLTGLYNAGAVKPSRMGAKVGPWRVLIYAVKIGILVSLTPLLDKVVGAELVVPIRLAAVLASVCAGSYARYYREENQDLSKSA
ncbi:hypothetical protein QOT17_000562 [Balamuthia mandrillaris]